jgi:predicted dehydrogenase
VSTFKIGILGLVHDHIWIFYQNDVKEIENCEITCASDPNKDLLERATKEYGVSPESLYTSHDEMLEKEDLDAVLVFAPSNQHGVLTEKAARKGLHVMVEKPMAASLSEADRMIEAAKENNVRLMINYPIAHKPEVAGLVKMVRDGDLGHVYSFRWRMGHRGPENSPELTDYFREWLFDPVQNGGGAMADFCTYGAAVLTAALGRGNEVSAVVGNLVKKNQMAEDNGVVTVKYEGDNSAIAILEGTWSQMAPGASNCVFGEKGSVSDSPMDPWAFQVRRPGEPAWSPIEFPRIAEDEDKAIKYFVNRIRKGIPFEGLVAAENARAAQEIIEAAYKSVESGCKIKLPMEAK